MRHHPMGIRTTAALSFAVATAGLGCDEAGPYPNPAPVVAAEVKTDAAADTGDQPDAQTEAGPDSADAESDGPIGPGPGEWTACPLMLDNPWGTLAECARFPVPLRWSEPNGPTIDVFVQRYRPESDTKRGQLWLLQGGPGGSGAAYDQFMASFAAVAPEWDLYAPDHRGVGRSARLGCPEEDDASEGGIAITESEWQSCLASLQQTWGDDLREFTITAAARDMGRLIELTKEPGKDVFVYGASYGTTWAHRYLQVHPNQATGVILDSLAIHIYFTDYDLFFNQVGEDFIAYCADDATCTSKLGADPWQELGAVFEQIDQGHCADFFQGWTDATPRTYLRYVLASLLMNWDLRPFLPAVAYRLRRCDAADVKALLQMRALLFETPVTYYQRLDSGMLGDHIGLSEFWPDPPPPLSQLQSIVDAAYTSIDVAPRMGSHFDAWPKYAHDAYFDAWAQPEVPVLMLNGDLDPQTPIWVAEPARTGIQAEHAYFFALPRVPHGAIFQSPTTTGTESCGQEIMRAFLDDPTKEPGAGCADSILPIRFQGEPGYAMWAFGQEDMWENTAATSLHAVKAQPPPGLALFRETVRRSWPRSGSRGGAL